MGSCFLAATRALTALLIALACTAQAAPFVYVTQPSLGSVAVIDAAINTVAATIGVGDNPRGIAITRSGTRGYTANITSDTVTFLDLVGNSAITTVPVASLPIAVALSADETRLFVASYGASVLSVIDIASRSTITTIPLIARPLALALHPSGEKLYVLYDSTSDRVSVIDTTTNTLSTNLNNRPDVLASGLAVSPSGAELYVANSAMRSIFDPPPGSDLVTVINTAGVAPVASISVGDQVSTVIFASQTNKAYVAAYSHVKVIDPSSRSIVASIPVIGGSVAVAYLPELDCLYVTNYESNVVTVINASTASVLTTIPVSGPISIAVVPSAAATASAEPIPTLSVPMLILLASLVIAVCWRAALTPRSLSQ